ncbi:MAG: hypothetical protein Q9213_001478 [Squamulea squamosa]
MALSNEYPPKTFHTLRSVEKIPFPALLPLPLASLVPDKWMPISFCIAPKTSREARCRKR